MVIDAVTQHITIKTEFQNQSQLQLQHFAVISHIYIFGPSAGHDS